MEKLQPLLVHRFWIAFGLALLLPGIGWGLGTRALKLETKTAWDQADSAFRIIPGVYSANPKWLAGLNNRNTDLTSMYNKSKLDLAETQKHQMKWPVGNTEKSKEVGGLWHQADGKLQEIPLNGKIPRQLCRDYRVLYFRELKRIYKTVDPYDTQFWTGRGKVIFNLISVTPLVREQYWARLPPTPREVWEAQEDLWLLESLLSAITEVNLEAKSLTESPIRQISQIILRGGDPEALKAASQSVSAGSVGTSRGGFGGGGEEGMGSGPGLGAGGAGQRGGFSINLDQIFGPVGGGVGSPGFGGGEEGMGGPPGSGANALKRYVDDETGAPFKTRGFLLQVIMDHRKLPELKIQLSNLEWPVEIVQVHQMEGSQAVGLSSSGFGGGGEEGMGAGAGFASAGMRNMNLGAFGMGEARRQTTMSPNGLPPGFSNMSFTEAQEIQRKAQETFSAALQGPFLVSVAIAGKMTLFQPADGQSATSVAAANGAAPATSAGTGQTAPGTVDGLQEPPDAEPSGDVAADGAVSPAATQTPSAQQADSSETKSDSAETNPGSQPSSQPQQPPGDGTPSQQPSPASPGPAAGKSSEDGSG